MKYLSNKATVLDSNGYITQRGVTVVVHPATATHCETVQIGATEHRVDDLEISTDRIRSKLCGWEVAL